MKNQKFVIKNTLGMFDLYKGLIMILVVVSHTTNLFPFMYKYSTMSELFANVNFFALLLAFLYALIGEPSMAALFILSGYGFRKTTNKKCFHKQLQTLVIPYYIAMLVATVLHLFSYYLIYGGLHHSVVQTIKIFLGGLLAFPTDRGINDFWMLACGPIWFLPALAIATFVFNILVNNFDGVALMIASLVVTIIGWLMSFAGPLPFSISQAFVSVIFLWIGYYIKKNKLFTTPIDKKLSISLAIIIIPYMIYANLTKIFAMAIDEYALGPVSIIVNGLIAAVTIKLFLYLNIFNGRIITFIRQIGRYSLYFLCIHSIEMVAVGNYIQYLFINKWWKGDPALRSIIIIGVRLPIAIVFTFLFVKLKDSINKSGRS